MNCKDAKDLSIFEMVVGVSQNEIGAVIDHDRKSGDENVLIICNKRDTYGASYIAIPRVLEAIYRRFKENYYIVLMSVHELMCVKCSYAFNDGRKSEIETEDGLADMVDAINSQNDSWKDILSYKIYYYVGDDGKHLIVI